MSNGEGQIDPGVVFVILLLETSVFGIIRLWARNVMPRTASDRKTREAEEMECSDNLIRIEYRITCEFKNFVYSFNDAVVQRLSCKLFKQ